MALLLVTLAVSLTGCGATGRLQVQKVRVHEREFSQREQRKMVQSLSVAEKAWETVTRPQATPEAERRAWQQYADSLAVCLDDWRKAVTPLRWEQRTTISAGGRSYQLRIAPKKLSLEEFSPNWVDGIIPAREVDMSRTARRVTKEGFGLPVVMTRTRSEEVLKRSPMVPLNGAYQSATAVAEFGEPDAQSGGATPVTFRFINSARTDKVAVGGRKVPLAHDLSAAAELTFSPKFFNPLRWLGFFNPSAVIDETQVFRVDLYDPQRIPVVFVHGLNSDPHIWHAAYEAIMRDEKLRANYQFWYFFYPTGLPVPTSAARLRASLDKARDFVDPEHDDPGMSRMVLVGHSMGGLLSRMQVIDSGDAFWNALFTVPPEKLPLSKADEASLRRALYFDRRPYVDRAVFVATPHRGSKIADWGPISLIVKLIKIPQATLQITQSLAKLPQQVVSPSLARYESFGTRSIQTLSPGHPYFDALEKRPILVPFHSIIGDRGRGPGPTSSDGVVPYWSSHLEGAQSEKIVPHGHSCTHSEAVTAEIARILHQHLRESGKTTRQPQTKAVRR